MNRRQLVLLITVLLETTGSLLNRSIAAETPASPLQNALVAMKSKEWATAKLILTSIPTASRTSIDFYCLAVCYSFLFDVMEVFSNSVEALTRIPKLEEPYLSAAKELARRSGLAIANPKTRARFTLENDSEPGRDLAAQVGDDEAASLRKREFDALKARIRNQVDIDAELKYDSNFNACSIGPESCKREFQNQMLATTDQQTPIAPFEPPIPAGASK